MSYQYEVIYFDIHGRAEPIRLLLTMAGAPFQDRVVVRDTWMQLKPEMPLMQLPVLVEKSADGQERLITQSQAILRHLARRHDLYGRDDAQRLAADVVADTAVDIGTSFNPLLFGPTRGDMAVAEKYWSETWPVNTRKLERLLERAPTTSGLFAGDKPTFGDLAAFQVLATHLAVRPDCLDAHPSLRAFYDTVASVPALAGYLAGRRKSEAAALAKSS